MTEPFRLVLAGNPNVGKSTVFNALTGMHQHTGNWTGKTVDLAAGTFVVKDRTFHITDLPGTYSLHSASFEEAVATDAICFQQADYTLIVADATALSRNLTFILQILELTPNVALCVNLMDEAKRKDILVDTDALARRLGIPVLGISAKNRKDIRQLKAFIYALTRLPFSVHSKALTRYAPPIEAALDRLCSFMVDFPPLPFRRRFLAIKALDNPSLFQHLLSKTNLPKESKDALCALAEEVRQDLFKEGFTPMDLWDSTVSAIVETGREIAAQCTRSNTTPRVHPAEKLLTAKSTGIPMMLLFLSLLLWITISGANVPSELLFQFFSWAKGYLAAFSSWLHLPPVLSGILLEGVYQCTAWVISVMMPPMLIFFPLFSLLEDFGVLPRLAFNLDRCFQKAGSCGKQALTMCMGLGCNAVGVTGCRIIQSEKERLLAMLTNSFIPCNGRFPLLIAILTLFFVGGRQGFWGSLLSALSLTCLLVFAIFMTLLATFLLSRFLCGKDSGAFVLELPPYRKPQIGQTLVRSFKDRCLLLLGRAVSVAAPFGILLYALSNLSFGGISLLSRLAELLGPFGRLMGLDGMILMAFVLSFPANELFLPILLMGYLSGSTLTDFSSLSQLQAVFANQGWTMLTALNVMIFSMLHWPCGTVLLTFYKESHSVSQTLLAFLLPTVFGIFLCMITNGMYNLCT